MMDDAALLGLGLHADSQAQQRSAQYFEQLKHSDSGWLMCINALLTRRYETDNIRFFCLQVIEHFLKTRYSTASDTDQQTIRNYLISWFQGLNNASCNGAGGGPAAEKSFILNKVAQLFVNACLVDYSRRWPSFFDDLISSMSMGPRNVDLCLRVLLALYSEVVDRDIVHSEQELQRNTQIKDDMRIRCIDNLVNSWYVILTTYETTHPSLVCTCLDVIGHYVSWIEINLIANDRFVTVLLRFMSVLVLRESACDCVHEIISKGMDPTAKTALIESFTTVLKTSGVLSRIDESEEGDFLAKLSKLVNGMGVQLIQCWQKLVKSKDPTNASVTANALESKLPYMLWFLANSDDDVSGTIAPFAHEYVTLLKQSLPLNPNQKEFIKELLFVLIKKMKYDDLTSYDFEGEEEAMFQEYRKELRVIFSNVGALDSEMIVSLIHGIVSQTLTNWQSSEVRDIELAVFLLYQLGEALPASHNQHFTGDPTKATALQIMIKLLLTSHVSQCNHPVVQLQFFETIVRYEKFFNCEPQYLPDVLTAFLDERGLWNTSKHVSSRTSYLFSRFVKSVNKLQLQGYLEQILDRVQGLLIISSPYNGIQQQTLSPEDQQFMYETAGILIVQSQFTPERKQELMRCLLAPIVNKFDGLLQGLMAEHDVDRQAEYAACINNAMGFASRTSKGFSGQQTVKSNGCTEVYVQTLKVFLHALNVPVQRSILHQGVRQFLHRMVVCLDADILQFIPLAMESLLKQADVRELYDFIPFVNQVVVKFKKAIVPFIQQVFMPIVSTIFRALSASIDERDQVSLAERKLLQRGYYTFISTLVNNNVTEGLSSQSSQNLQEVLETVIQGAIDFPDPIAQKMCFGILKKLVEVWGDNVTLPGFNDFIYKRIVPACIMGPVNPTFDLSDAQSVLALNESASCLKSVHDKRGDEFLAFLQVNYLPTLNLTPPAIQEFCRTLMGESKEFQTYFKSFIVRAKSS